MQKKDNSLSVEQWDIYEWVLKGPADGNPFAEVTVGARFSQGSREVDVNGFYDGEGTYRIRFMPDTLGEWRCLSHSNREQLDGAAASFVCIKPAAENHGPVTTDGGHSLRYSDNTPYSCIGTTAYAWIHQGDALAEATLKTLRASPFNKIRMTVFPKSYRYNEHNDPDRFVFPVLKKGRTDWDGNWDSKGTASGWEFDHTRFDVQFFAMLEKRIEQLKAINVEADIILFHPYDRWGLAQMDQETDLRYLRYLIARLSAYRNVWWSLANEFDFMRAKTVEDWETIGRAIAENDPYHHMTGIHNGAKWFDHARPWITHCSIQTSNFEFSRWLETWHKPIVIDEMCYEGNISEGWGNISAQEMVHRFWEVAVQGGYPGHSEVYLTPEHIMWWNKGGQLRGESPRRIGFLREMIEAGPDTAIAACSERMGRLPCGQKGEQWILGYTGIRQPIEITASLPAGKQYRLLHIDTWNMSVIQGNEIDTGNGKSVRIPLTGKPHMAFLLEAK